MSAQEDWAAEAAKHVMVAAYTRENARDLVAEILRETWRQGKVVGFQQGQQSVIDFQTVMRNAATGQWPT